MKLSNKLIKDFADIINNKSSEKNVSNQIQGIVVNKDSDNVYVRLNGSQSLTPVKMGVGAKEGDTVLVSIMDHIATITGNISAPASTTIADNYMRYDEEGLSIGKLVDGKPVGAYCIIDPNESSFSIKQTNDDGSITPISTFGKDSINLGLDDFSVISFCGNRASINYENDTQSVFINSEGIIGLNAYDEGTLCSSINASPGAIELNTSGIVWIRADNGIYAGGIDNNDVVLTAKDIQIHYVEVKVQTSTAANAHKEINVQLEVPDGHRAVSLLQVYSNHRDIFRLTTFGIGPTNNLRLAWFNAGTKAYTVTFYVYYVTLPITLDNKLITHSDIVVSS